MNLICRLGVMILILIIAFIVSCSDEASVVDPSPAFVENPEFSGTLNLKMQGTYPDNGDIEIPVDVDIVLVFSKAVDTSSIAGNISGITPVGFAYSGDNRVVTIDVGTLSFNNSYTVTINSGMRASDGYTLDQDYSYSFTTGLDTSNSYRPRVIAGSRYPADGATGVNVNLGYVEVTLTEDITTSTINLTTCTIAPNVASGVDTSISAKTFRINLSTPLSYNTMYTVDLTSGIQDTSGNSLVEDGDDTWSFTTESDPDTGSGLPAITSVWVTDVDTSSAVIKFNTNYPVAANQCSVAYGTDTDYSAGAVTEAGGATMKTTHSVSLPGPLTQSTIYYFNVTADTEYETTDPVTGQILTFVTEGDGSSDTGASTSAGDKSDIAVIQNNNSDGILDGSSYLFWINGANIYGYYFVNDTTPTAPWTANGDLIDTNSRTNLRAFPEGRGYAIVTMEDGANNIYAKVVYNDGGNNRAFLGYAWGNAEGDNGLNIGTGTNPGAAIVWGYQGNNNVDGGFITNRTSGTALVFADNANYIYDYDVDFTSLGINTATDIVVDSANHDNTDIANIGGAGSFRHIIQQNTTDAVNATDSYAIADGDTNNDTDTARDHRILITDSGALVNDYEGSANNQYVYTTHGYAQPGWLGLGDILFDGTNYRIISNTGVSAIAITKSTIESGTTTGTSTDIVIDAGAFAAVLTNDIIRNTDTGECAVVTKIDNDELNLDKHIFSVNSNQNYDIDRKGASRLTGSVTGIAGDQINDTANDGLLGGWATQGVVAGDIIQNTTTGSDYAIITDVQVWAGGGFIEVSDQVFIIGDNYEIFAPSDVTQDISGTWTNPATSDRLIDSADDFTLPAPGVRVGDIAYINASTYTMVNSLISSAELELVDYAVTASGQAYEIYNGEYCDDHYPNANHFDSFYQIEMDANLAVADGTGITLYDAIVSGTAEARPSIPLFDNNAARDFTGDGVLNNDLVINTDDYNNPGDPNIARVDTGTGPFPVQQRALNLDTDIMSNGEAYQILNLNPNVINGDILETGDVNNVASQNILVDGGGEADFTAAGVEKGDLVYNISDQIYAVVVSVDSATQLTLNKNTFDTVGDEYIVFSSDERLSEAGTVTTSGNPFTDTNSNFSNVEIGDIVHNNSTGNEAYVTVIAGQQLTLSSNIMTAIGQRYVVIQPRVLFAWEGTGAGAGNIYGALARLRDGSIYQGTFSICTHADTLQNVKVVSAGQGMAFVIYEDSTDGNIYGKRINGIGGFVNGGGTPSRGINLGSGNLLDIKSDNNNRVFVLYENGTDIYITSRNIDLTQYWIDNFTGSAASSGADPVMATDSANGPIVAYADDAGNVYIRHYDIDGNGGAQVTINGFSTYVHNNDSYKSNISITGDGSDGALVSWIDDRYYPENGYIICAQAVDGAGTRLWDADAHAVNVDLDGCLIAISTAFDDDELFIKSVFYNDGGTPFGGLFLWLDYRNNRADIYYDIKNN
ncbi:MAG: Ig-like domain-containing protein [Spirochaetota bacterium]|nr:Ig-like domain-containing protein [Spirochaetota bacterium]